MKYLYVVVSDSSDIFLEQALVSIMSLRLQMPNSFITLLTDDVTHNNIKEGKLSGILDLLNEIQVEKLDNNLDKKQRSRILKCNMRNFVNGDFLFIDADTVITDDLTIADNLNCNIAAVLNCHTVLENNSVNSIFLLYAQKLVFSAATKKKHFNSGVMFVKDNETTRKFFRKWNEFYEYSVTKNIFIDQPALAQTDSYYGGMIEELNGEWNCQIDYGLNYLSKAKILHFWQGNDLNPTHPLMTKNFYMQIKNESLDKANILKTIKNVKNLFYEDSCIVRPYVYENKTMQRQLLAFCSGKERIFIYGAGFWGKETEKILKIHNIKIEAFLVTKKEGNLNFYNDIPVYEFSETNIEDKDGIIIALKTEFINEILHFLFKRSIKNIHIFN